eukprot:6389610-Pyramimonas_sp.AAC.1
MRAHRVTNKKENTDHPHRKRTPSWNYDDNENNDDDDDDEDNHDDDEDGDDDDYDGDDTTCFGTGA